MDRYHVQVEEHFCYKDPLDPEFDPKFHHLDIYRPVASSLDCKFPVIMYIHGGAWISGDKQSPNTENVAVHLASRGYVVCCISYRLSALYHQQLARSLGIVAILFALLLFSKRSFIRQFWFLLLLTLVLFILYSELQDNPIAYLFPCHLHDAKDAFLWIRSNIDDFQGDPNDIHVMGHSAGAHIALMMVCYRPLCEASLSKQEQVEEEEEKKEEHDKDEDEDEDKQLMSKTKKKKTKKLVVFDPKHIRSLVLISGVYNIHRLRTSQIGPMVMKNVFGGEPSQWDEYFPFHWIREDTWLPPVMILNGEFEFGLKIHSYELMQMLSYYGRPFEQKCYKTMNHFSIVTFWNDQHSRVPDDIHSFLSKHHHPYFG